MSKPITIQMKLQPFVVPNFVGIEMPPRKRQHDFAGPESSSLPLSSIDETSLEEPCQQFANAAFAKAGKQRPPKLA